MFLALFFATHINIFTFEILKNFKIFLYNTKHSATINIQFRCNNLSLCTFTPKILYVNEWADTLSLNDGCFQAYIPPNNILRILNSFTKL